MNEETGKDEVNLLIQPVTQGLIELGYTVATGYRTLEDDFCLLVTDPKSPYQSRCLVAFWPATRAWPLAVFRGDQLYNTGDSAQEIIAVVTRCLADQAH
jgi:hypothetical protein